MARAFAAQGADVMLNGLGGVEHGFCVGDRQGQTVAHRGLGVETHSEQQCRSGHLGSDRAMQHPGGTPAGMNAQLLKAGVEQRVRAGDADIGGQCQVHARAHRCAVDRGDSRK